MTKKHFCKPCNKEFTDRYKLKRHLEDSGAHTQTAKHECEICHNFYMSKDGLRQHVRTIHEKKKIRRRECPLCEKSYCDGKGLKNHLASVHEQGKKSHKCEYCGLTFMFLTPLNNHIRFTHKKDMAKFCKFCDKGFSNNRPLDTHYQGVHSYCMQCDLKFDQKAQFTKHMREIHHKVKAKVTCKFCNLELRSKIINHYRAIHFYCSDECDLRFDTKPEILEHLETSHSNEAFKGYMGEANKCNLCEHKTRKSTDLESHYRYIHFHCTVCEITFKAKETFQIHMKEVHLEDYTCTICQKVFLDNERLNEHMKQRHSDNRYWRKRHACDICHKVLSSKLTMREHKNVMHFNIKKPKDKEKSFKCDKCDFSTSYEGNLVIHRKSHDIPLTECDICHKQVKLIKEHIKRIHQTELDFTCNLCDFKGKTDAAVQSHIKRKHSVTRETYKCDICNKELSCKSSLNKHHQLVHEDAKDLEKFKCDKCDYTSYTKQHLRNHKETHEDIVRQCDQCDYKCKALKTLNIHKKSHLPTDEQLKCSDCSFITHSKNSYNNHLRKHLPEEEIKCPKCSYVTPCKSWLETHTLTFHEEDLPCQICDFVSVSIQEYRQHNNRKHNQTKCDYCDFESTCTSQMRSHLKKCKDTEARYICEVCDMQFSTGLARYQHKKREHGTTDEKDTKFTNKCDICDHQSSSREEHNRHVNQKHSNTKCDYCDFESTSPTNMRAHMKKCKDTEGRYVCENCGKQYSNLSARSKHIQKDH